MEKQYDPILREAMAEISGIMTKYDIGGMVLLNSVQHGEFKYFLEPSWSQARIVLEDDGSMKGIHFKLRKNKMREVNGTAGLLYGIRDMAAQAFMAMDQFSKQLEGTVEVEHNLPEINNDDR